ncbi:glycosyltransferase family 39 protein [Actinacidiphila glaucinigra]|uniref:glycosyltransferase family 39 protein n=1 Tax=Actinacidiphila glaucinigra TaxID=235986 RepID=UPI003D8A6CD1
MSATHVRAHVAPFAAVPVLGVAGAVAAVLTALSGRYGFHRDELYFLVAGDHPAWGYVDQPPLTPLAARLSTAVFGDTPAGLRVVATLACAVTVVTVAAVARELGGGRAAQVLAAACTAVSGFVLAVGHLVSTATFDMLAWVVVCWLLLRLLRTGDRRLWLALGAALGVGMQNKYLIALLALSLLVALLATGPRQVLRGRWPLAGAAVALAVALPSLWWQAAHGWPQLTVAGGISADDGAENRVLFVPQQIVFLSPVFVPVWIAGGLRLWRDPALRWARAFVPAYLLLAVVVVVSGGKPYYCLPLLLVLLAAGCVTSVSRPRVMWPAVALTAVISALISLPVLPPGVVGAVNGVNKEQGEQIGWPHLADAVAEVRRARRRPAPRGRVRPELRRGRRPGPLRSRPRPARPLLRPHEFRRLGPAAGLRHRPGAAGASGGLRRRRTPFHRLPAGRPRRQRPGCRQRGTARRDRPVHGPERTVVTAVARAAPLLLGRHDTGK